MRYVELDLRELKRDLGAHWDPTMEAEYTMPCPLCQEQVPQDANECPVCGIPAVWHGSKAWKRLYGSPRAMMRMLSVIEPEEPTGEALCREAGVPGFANQTEADRWRRAANKLGKQRMLGIVRYVVEDRRRRGRGAMAHALNLAEKIAREEAGKRKRKPRAAVDVEERELLF